MSEVVFYVFAAVAIVSAVLAITRKNAVASALWLVLMFFSLAGVYVMLEAYFVAVVQVLVYAGAIMVLFLFVIMLLGVDRDDQLGTSNAARAVGAEMVGVLLAGGLLAVVGAFRLGFGYPAVVACLVAGLVVAAPTVGLSLGEGLPIPCELCDCLYGVEATLLGEPD